MALFHEYSHVDPVRLPFTAYLTEVAAFPSGSSSSSGSSSGSSSSSSSSSAQSVWVYAWKEQECNPLTGQYQDAPSGRFGDTTNGPFLVEVNNINVKLPTYARIWLRGVVNGVPWYEFRRCCSSFVPCTACPSLPSTLFVEASGGWFGFSCADCDSFGDKRACHWVGDCHWQSDTFTNCGNVCMWDLVLFPSSLRFFVTLYVNSVAQITWREADGSGCSMPRSCQFLAGSGPPPCAFTGVPVSISDS